MACPPFLPATGAVERARADLIGEIVAGRLSLDRAALFFAGHPAALARFAGDRRVSPFLFECLAKVARLWILRRDRI